MRDRAMHSGMLELAVSKNMLPDEFIAWIIAAGTTSFLSNWLSGRFA